MQTGGRSGGHTGFLADCGTTLLPLPRTGSTLDGGRHARCRREQVTTPHDDYVGCQLTLPYNIIRVASPPTTFAAQGPARDYTPPTVPPPPPFATTTCLTPHYHLLRYRAV